MQRLSGRLRPYGSRSLTIIKPQGASFEKRSGHIYFMEDYLLHAISKLRHVQFHVVTKVLRIVGFHMTSQKFKLKTIDPTEILLSRCIRRAEN